VAPFILALLFILAVALAVVAAFALPHLRAGSPLLTPKGEQVARGARVHLRRIGDAMPDRLAGPISAGLSDVRVRIAGRGESEPLSASASMTSTPPQVGTQPESEPVVGAAPVRIDRRIFAPRRRDEGAPSPAARR